MGERANLNKSANGKPANYSIYQITGGSALCATSGRSVGRSAETPEMCTTESPGFMPSELLTGEWLMVTHSANYEAPTVGATSRLEGVAAGQLVDLGGRAGGR